MIFYVLTQSRHLESRQCEIWSVVAAGAVENRPNLTFPCLCRDFFVQRAPAGMATESNLFFLLFLNEPQTFPIPFRFSCVSDLVFAHCFLKGLCSYQRLLKKVGARTLYHIKSKQRLGLGYEHFIYCVSKLDLISCYSPPFGRSWHNKYMPSIE